MSRPICIHEYKQNCLTNPQSPDLGEISAKIAVFKVHNNKIICKINHTAGFFSNCTVILITLIKYFYKNNKLPDEIDTSITFNWYSLQSIIDIRSKYFKVIFNNNINNFEQMNELDYTFLDNDLFNKSYKNINFDILKPFIERFFSPSNNILNIIEHIEKKYNIDYDNTCCVFFRGLDKGRENIIPTYDDIITKVKEVTKDVKNLRFLIQSDETEFLDYSKSIFENHIIFKEEIRHVNKCDGIVENQCNKKDNYKYSCLFLAIVIIMSKCKYLIFNSSNVSLWITLFRGHTKNVYQFLKQKKIIYGILNKYYKEDTKTNWY